jgi:DNA primase
VSGFTNDHHAAFRRHGVTRVLLAYGRTEAGDTAAAALAEELLAQGIGCYRIQFPRGMDANRFARKCAPSSESLGGMIRHAVWLGSGPPPPGTSVGPSISGAPRPAPAAFVEPLTSPEAPPSPEPVVVAAGPHEHTVTLGERCYRIRGLARNRATEMLRVTLVVRQGAAVFADTVDLYAAHARARCAEQAAKALEAPPEAISQELGNLLLELEQLRDQLLSAGVTSPRASQPFALPPMTVSEREAALALLRDPRLLERISADFARAGVVGETTNCLVGYLATLSRKLPRPLAVVIQSTSAAGKTSLMDALLAFVPPEDRVRYAALTGQALYYLGECDLQHKVLSLAEEERAQRATYALKLLQSGGHSPSPRPGRIRTRGSSSPTAITCEGRCS